MKTLNSRSATTTLVVSESQNLSKHLKNKIIKLKDVNYRQDLPSLRRFLEISIRLCPSDPIYSIDKLVIKSVNELEISSESYEVLQESLMSSLNVTIEVINILSCTFLILSLKTTYLLQL